MEFKDLTLSRRSVRAYAEPASHDEIAAILEEARMAPSWKNSQTWRCYVIESPEQIAAFREAALPSFNAKNTVHAAYIVTTFVKNISGFSAEGPENEPGNCWGAYDLGLHDAYLVLSARDHGLDTLIMGIRDGAAIRKFLEIPENEEIMSVISVGKRAAEPALRPRKALEETTKYF